MCGTAGCQFNETYSAISPNLLTFLLKKVKLLSQVSQESTLLGMLFLTMLDPAWLDEDWLGGAPRWTLRFSAGLLWLSVATEDAGVEKTWLEDDEELCPLTAPVPIGWHSRVRDLQWPWMTFRWTWVTFWWSWMTPLVALSGWAIECRWMNDHFNDTDSFSVTECLTPEWRRLGDHRSVSYFTYWWSMPSEPAHFSQTDNPQWCITTVS